jgi:uncharacterized membrane protein
MTAKKADGTAKKRRAGPIRAAVLRGLAVVLPPLLTIVIFVWALGLIKQHVYDRVYGWTLDAWVWVIEDIKYPEELPVAQQGKPVPVLDGRKYQRLTNGGRPTYVPAEIYEKVTEDTRVDVVPTTGWNVYRRYVQLNHLQPQQAIPYFLCSFILFLYLLGKFMAAGAGRIFWGAFERVIHRVPFVRKVYASVKQVSDFLLTEPAIEYSRVVVVEWPRKGIWCLALVTGPSLREVRTAAGEEVLSVLIPTSPMPMTGFTVTVKKSETIDLEITVDEAVQFIVSCGVVVPPGHVKGMQLGSESRAELVAASDVSRGGSGDS